MCVILGISGGIFDTLRSFIDAQIIQRIEASKIVPAIRGNKQINSEEQASDIH